MWGFNNKNNKSKFKKKASWYDDDYYDESRYAGDDINEGYGRSYAYNYYKPKFDMSIGLGTRVRQLIRTITGKDLKLVEANGWGNDDKYFYYNPADLENSSDDEILGRILHQLAKELYVDNVAVKQINDKDPEYKHLLNTLEDNRADYQLQQRYVGVSYYAQETWETRKFKDNPINYYEPLIEISEDGIAREMKRLGYSDDNFDRLKYRTDLKYQQEYNQWATNRNTEKVHNPAWEFNFNISAYQNGETMRDFELPEIEANFELALPFIQKYLAEPNFDDAYLKYYEDIKKYYPKPTKQQQDQMNKKMGQSEGLSQEEMEEMSNNMKAREARGSGKKGEAKGEESGQEIEVFIRDFADDYRTGKFDIEKNIAKYKEYLARYKGIANVLYTLIRSILKDNTANRYDRPFKRGKLDAKRIYKYISTDNLRIFKRKRVINEKDYLMMIVVDMSGSMKGGNSEYATKGAIVLADVIERLKFPYEIIAYNGNVYGVKMFNRPLKPEILPALENANGDNNERETIEVITKHISKYDPSNTFKKSIFWITDGQSNDPQTVKKKVGELERKHNATVFAIGIGHVEERFLKESYNTYMMVDKIEDLPKELTNLMRGQFRRK